jgi:hypothetical protein
VSDAPARHAAGLPYAIRNTQYPNPAPRTRTLLRILRQLTAEELQRAAVHSGARPGAPPEEIIRSLSRLCGATLWGIFPVTTDDMLLDFVGRRLGMPPMVGGIKGVPERERAIFSCYLRQAWHAADPERRWTILSAAAACWDTPPSPELPRDNSEDMLGLACLETMLQYTAGCRALAVATEQAAMPLPGPEPRFGPIPLRFAYGVSGHQALYGVLRVLWRARFRLLRERRAQYDHLERQLKHVESLLDVRARNLSETPSPWALNPASGLSLTAAAGVSAAVQLAMAAAASPIALIPAAVVGAAGIAWTASALAFGPSSRTNPRTAQMQSQIQTLRFQLDQVTQEIHRLQTE